MRQRKFDLRKMYQQIPLTPKHVLELKHKSAFKVPHIKSQNTPDLGLKGTTPNFKFTTRKSGQKKSCQTVKL